MSDENFPDKVWDIFWKEICTHPDGSLSFDQIKKELCDFYCAMKEVCKVYDHITGGQISKIMTDASVVIERADAHYEDMYEESMEEAYQRGRDES